MTALRIETGVDKLKLFSPLGSFQIRDRSKLDYAPPHEKQGTKAPIAWAKCNRTGEELAGRLYHNFPKYGAKIELSDKGFFLEFNPSKIGAGSWGLISDTTRIYEIANQLINEKSEAVGLDFPLENLRLSRLDLARQIVHDECQYGDYTSIFNSLGAKLKRPSATFPTSHTWENTSRKFQTYGKDEELSQVYGLELGYNVNRFEARYETGKAFKSTLNLQEGSFSSFLSLGLDAISEEWKHAAKRDVFGNGIQLVVQAPDFTANPTALEMEIKTIMKGNKLTGRDITKYRSDYGVQRLIEEAGGIQQLRTLFKRLGMNKSSVSIEIKKLKESNLRASLRAKHFTPEAALARHAQLIDKLELRP